MKILGTVQQPYGKVARLFSTQVPTSTTLHWAVFLYLDPQYNHISPIWTLQSVATLHFSEEGILETAHRPSPIATAVVMTLLPSVWARNKGPDHYTGPPGHHSHYTERSPVALPCEPPPLTLHQSGPPAWEHSSCLLPTAKHFHCQWLCVSLRVAPRSKKRLSVPAAVLSLLPSD